MSIVKIFHVLVFHEVDLLREFIFESRNAPVNIVARRTLLWVDARLNTYCENWQCNNATEAAASRFRTVSHTRSGRHNCPCPSYTAQTPRKTNTTVCEVPGPVRASEMRVNPGPFDCVTSHCTLVWARVYNNATGAAVISHEREEKLDPLLPDKTNWNHDFGTTGWKEGSFIVFNKSSLFARLYANCRKHINCVWQSAK